MDLFSQLAPRLPEPPARVLAVGWRRADDARPGGTEREITWAARDEALRPCAAGYDALVWKDSGADGEVGGLIDGARRLLAEEGRVIVVAPAEAAGGGEALPSRRQARLREIVRRLSEEGFAILRDGTLRPPAGGEGSAFKVFSARRDPFVIRSCREGDEEAILRLFESCFHQRRDPEHWRWKYVENPWGSRKISLAFSPEGELASHYGGYPVPFWSAVAGDFLSLQMGDTMTGPAYRDVGRGRSGLLARTVRHFFSIHRGGDFGFFYGFNTGPIQRFCRWFIGGSRILPVGYRVRRLEPEPGWSARGYRVERVASTGEEWDRFFRRVAPRYRFLVRRDARYLDWRYLRCPDADFVLLAARRWGRLVGWSVFRRSEDRLVWGDALFARRHAGAAEPILAAALATPELAGASRVEAWFPEEPSWWHRRLAKLGFSSGPQPDGLAMMALHDSEQAAPEKLRQLYYTMGDGDLF